MSQAIIHQIQTVMQSGKAKTNWVLEFRSSERSTDSIMGWTSSSDMLGQEVKLSFESQEDAVKYAKKHKLDYVVKAPNPRIPQRKIRPYSTIYTS